MKKDIDWKTCDFVIIMASFTNYFFGNRNDFSAELKDLGEFKEKAKFLLKRQKNNWKGKRKLKEIKLKARKMALKATRD
jgi:hypothetical protein